MKIIISCSCRGEKLRQSGRITGHHISNVSSFFLNFILSLSPFLPLFLRGLYLFSIPPQIAPRSRIMRKCNNNRNALTVINIPPYILPQSPRERHREWFASSGGIHIIIFPLHPILMPIGPSILI